MGSEGRPAKKRKIDFDDEVTVVVGGIYPRWENTYYVPKTILTKSSAFFKTTCNEDRKGGESETIKLEHRNPEIFEIYLQFLYIGEIVPVEEDLEAIESAVKRDDYTPWSTAIKAMGQTYLLAEEVEDVRCKNASIDFIIALTRINECGPWFDVHYHQPNEDSPLRRLLVDLVMHADNEEWQKEEMRGLGDEYGFDVALRATAMARAGEKPMNPCDRHKCAYHEHDEENPACE